MSDEPGGSWGSFQSPILGSGGILIRKIMQSLGFVAGSSGWALEQDGDAELNNVTVRGTVEVKGSNSSVLRVSSVSGQPQVSFTPEQTYPGQTVQAALITAFTSPGVPEADLIIQGPKLAGGGQAALLDFSVDNAGAYKTVAALSAERITLTASVDALVVSTVNGMVEASDGMQYLRGQMGDTTLAIASTDTVKASAVINFPVAFPAGKVPKMFVNNTNGGGGTTNWDAHAVNITNTGFQIIMRGGSGTAFTANLQWVAFSPV